MAFLPATEKWTSYFTYFQRYVNAELLLSTGHYIQPYAIYFNSSEHNI